MARTKGARTRGRRIGTKRMRKTSVKKGDKRKLGRRSSRRSSRKSGRRSTRRSKRSLRGARRSMRMRGGGDGEQKSYPSQEEQEGQIRHFINYLENSIGLGSLVEYENDSDKNYDIDEELIGDVKNIIKTIDLNGDNTLTKTYPRLTEYLKGL